MVIKLTKAPFRGVKFSLKDYEVKLAINSGGVTVQYKGQDTLLGVEELKAGKPSGVWCESRHNPGQKYQLIDFKWNPKTS
jgi:hypothetical protein